MPKTISYADAVRLLGGERSRAVDALDKITGGFMLAAAVPLPAVLGWFDAKAEFIRHSHELVREFTERRSGLSRYDRTARLAAAHRVLVVTAYFEALAEAELPFRFADLELTAEEQLRICSIEAVDDPLLPLLNATNVPVPRPAEPGEGFTTELDRYYERLSWYLGRFIAGLAIWDRLDETERDRFTAVLRNLPEPAVRRYRELLARLATDFPEVAFWTGLREHEATRGEVRAVADTVNGMTAALGELARLLEQVTSGRAPDARRAGLARAYRAVLDRPIVDSGDVPAGMRIPTLGAAYLPPLCRVAELDPQSRPGEETWWTEKPVRHDLVGLLTGWLTGPAATEVPLLVLGQPGSGKSVLTRVLAARLPAADFLPVRVVLRDVPAAADLQEQIEYAIRDATGERLDWPALARSADAALPVVLLDGFDEFLQATGVSQSDYLTKVARFQQREADQGRPVAVLVTTRTSVADRAQPPPGTLAVRLEPFDETRIEAWLSNWNTANADYLTRHGLAPLDLETVLAHRELAGQPLLLLMLALYDADGNALRASGDLARGELYERLLRSFARREVTKHRPGLSARDLDRAVEEELRRLAVVALAMFNRGVQWISADEVDGDLPALFGEQRSAASQPSGTRAPLSAAEIVLGRFFFIHRSQASRDGGRAQTYEFLHATFGEYLVARLVWGALADLLARDAAATMTLGGGTVDDGLLHALLSFATLTGRAPVFDFLVERLSTLDEARRTDLADLLIRLFRQVHEPRPVGRYDGYRPRVLPVPARYALHSANLLLLAVAAAGTVRGSDLYPGSDNVVRDWHAQTLLWRSQLSSDDYQSLIDRLALDRLGAGDERDVALRLDGGDFVPPPVDLAWTFALTDHPIRNGAAEDDRASGADYGLIHSWPNQFPERLSRRTHFECGAGSDTVQHALEPWADRLGAAVAVHADWPDMTVSAANLLMDLWLPQLEPGDERARKRLYRRAAGVAKIRWPGQREGLYAGLLLGQLATDPAVPASLVAEYLPMLADPDAYDDLPWLRAQVLRCGLAFLGRDPESDGLISSVLLNAVRPADGYEDDLQVETMVRLRELKLAVLEISESQFDEVKARLGYARPDLVARLRPYVVPDDGRYAPLVG